MYPNSALSLMSADDLSQLDGRLDEPRIPFEFCYLTLFTARCLLNFSGFSDFFFMQILPETFRARKQFLHNIIEGCPFVIQTDRPRE